MEHEIGFIGLTTISNKALCSVSAFDNVSFTADRLSMFAALLNNNLLKIETIDNVSFHFFTISGFSFKVERVERRGSYNTGWLITKLNKI